MSASGMVYGVDINKVKRILRINEAGTIENVPQSNTAPNFYVKAVIEKGSYELAEDTEIGNREITVSDATGIVIGDHIKLHENGGIGYRWLHGYIMAVNSGTGVLELDQEVDYFHQSGSEGSTVYIGNENLAVSGALDGSVYATIHNLGMGVKWDISKVNVYIQSATEPNDSEFGDQAALAYGMLFQFISPSGTFPIFNAYNVKSNHDLKMIASHGGVYESSKAGGGGSYGLIINKILGSDVDSVIRLDPDTNDEMRIILQDAAMSGVQVVNISMEGSLVTD